MMVVYNVTPIKPITRRLGTEEIENFKYGALGAGIKPLSNLLKLPSHKQATERTVKFVTEPLNQYVDMKEVMDTFGLKLSHIP